MKKTKIPILSLIFITTLFLTSCEQTKYLEVKGIAYQSMTTQHQIQPKDIPDYATIIVYCQIDKDGLFDVIIKNNTDNIMTIDRTKTFFRDGNGNSVPYYDPTIKVNTESVTQSNTTGGSVNLGSVVGAAGLGGALGTALNGVTVGGANSTATTNTSSTYMIDQPQAFIAPYSSANLGRTFKITGVGRDFLGEAINTTNQDINNTFTSKQTYASIYLCISYSIDNGETYETIITDIFANSLLISKVKKTGKVNDALRNVYNNKSNALSESWYLLFFESKANGDNDYYSNGSYLINYK